MPIEIKINNSPDPAARYITYAPSPCQIRQTPAAAPLNVTLSSRRARAGGGQAVFYTARTVGATPAATLALTLPADGAWVDFGLGGKFQNPSKADGDCLLVASSASANLTVPLMVRVRKNANTLTAAERDRFLMALARFNRATPPAVSGYQTLRNMHVDAGDPEEHGGPHFLAWHRIYLLDLERQLQAIDPSVALHYWRFDQPARNLFTPAFMGRTSRSSTSTRLVTVAPANPLSAWVTDSTPGIERRSHFNTATQAAPGLPAQGFALLTQAQTLALGPDYPTFRQMEGTPHGAAHVSFAGSISDIPTAPKDPLFFLLHSNVDRLWAMWQWLNRRTDSAQADTYTGQNRDGRRVGDTMWPWNQVTTPPRPNFAPGGALPASPLTAAPGGTPTVGSTIDYHGSRIGAPAAWLGFSYDDVPFDFTA